MFSIHFTNISIKKVRICFDGIDPIFDAVSSILTKLSSNNAAIHVLGEFPAYLTMCIAKQVRL